MFKNYLKLTIRNLLKHKAFSFINIFGLAIGMACCLLISLWVLDELSYERSFENSDRIHLVTIDRTFSSGKQTSSRSCPPLGPTLEAEFSEIELSARHRNLNTMLVRHQDKVFYEPDITTVDSSFFSIFNYKFKIGDKETALNQPNSIVISNEIALKYFGNENPIGKTLIFNNSDNYIVNGVIENVPQNSHIQFNIAIPWSYMEKKTWYKKDNWNSGFLETYVLLKATANQADVSNKIKDLFKKHIKKTNAILSLFPINDIHLYSNFFRSSSGNITYIYIFSGIAFLILLIACINFMNLSTAKSSNRSKEIGLRKVAGANKSQIIRQFYGESILMAFIALIFAVLLLYLFLPYFNSVTGKNISLFGTINSTVLFSGLFVTALITGLISGTYPALYLSSFNPITIFRGIQSRGTRDSKFRKPMVILQFSMSIFLIIVSFIVLSQLNYMLNMDTGWNKNNLIYVNMRSGPYEKYPILKSKLLSNPLIKNVSATQSLPTYFGNNTHSVNWPGKDPNQKIFINFTTVDFDFIKTLEINMDEGRTYSKEFKSDITNGIIINQEFKRAIGQESITGMQIDIGGEKRTIIGVTKDFHTHSAKNKMEPAVMVLGEKNLHNMMIRLDPNNISAALTELKKIWPEIIPQYPLKYTFFDERIKRSYRKESYISSLLGYSAFFAILIACLGLYGLASFTAEKRTKEIGIRKVLGASNHGILALFSSEFVKLIIIANIITWPLSYFVLNNWMKQFAYRAENNLLIYFLSGLAAIIIGIGAVSSQSIRAARANPVDSLKYK